MAARLQRHEGRWEIFDAQRLTSVENLFRLSLDTTQQFTATNLVIKAEDLDVTLETGSVFLSSTDVGVTGLVLLGRGEMRFHPKPETERGQVRIFSGSETLTARFDAAFIRVDPSDFDSLVASDALTARTPDPRDVRKAGEVFAEDSSKSFQVNLGDLSGDAWSLLPGRGNFIGEIHTRRYGTLTYTRSRTDAEDITLFDRTRRHNIAVYASEDTLARRGPTFSDDDNRDYDVLDYNIDLAYSPGRQFLDGVATVRVRVRASSLGTISLRLADALVVRSITSDRFGRLFGFRVNRQNVVVINLPATLLQDTELTLTFVYSGRLEAQSQGGSEAAGLGQDQIAEMPAGDHRRAELPLQQPERVVSAGHDDRLRHGHAQDQRAGRVRLRRERRPAAGVAADRGLERRPVRAPHLHVRRRTAAALSRVHRQQVRALGDGDGAVGRRQPGDFRRGEPAAGQARAGARRAGDGHRAVLRVAHRRRAVPDVHARGRRRRAAGRPQPGLLRAALPAAADDRAHLAQRSGRVRPVPGLLHRARARAPVVGTGGRLAQLPRAVDQRGLRAVLRGALRAAPARRRGVREHPAADAPVGDERIRPGAGRPGLSPRPHQGRQPRLPRARLQQERGGAAHAAAAGRRRGVLRRRAPLLRRVALPEGRHRRVPAGHRSSRRPAARSLLRPVDLRVHAAAAEGHLPRRGRRARRPHRAAGRDVRRPRHPDARIRGQDENRRRHPRGRTRHRAPRPARGRPPERRDQQGRRDARRNSSNSEEPATCSARKALQSAGPEAALQRLWPSPRALAASTLDRQHLARSHPARCSIYP